MDEWNHFLLRDLQCKHVPCVPISSKAETVLLLSRRANYPYAVFGSHQGHTHEMDYYYILDLTKAHYRRPIKIVITKDGRLWADNTHWTIANVLLHGLDAQVKDVPHYIIDLRSKEPTITNLPASFSPMGLNEAIENAQAIQNRLEQGWRPMNVSYTIGDLISELRYLR